jgi:hypothetical protein
VNGFCGRVVGGNWGPTAEFRQKAPEIGVRPQMQSAVVSGRWQSNCFFKVQRIAQWYIMGAVPEEIVRKIPHLSLAQVHAALAYYHANMNEIDSDLAHEAKETARLDSLRTS